MLFEEKDNLREVDLIDREWEKERPRYMVATRYGRRYVPSTGAAVVVGLFSVCAGLVWTMATLAMTQSLGGLAGVFPLVGIVFIGGGATISYYQFQKAKRYQAAHRAYQQRRLQAQEQTNDRSSPSTIRRPYRIEA